MPTRMRKSVYSPDGQIDLQWFSRAVAVMKQRPSTDPTSWFYQAGIHGYNLNLPVWQNASPLPPAAAIRKYWGQCQHGSWYFLPWHRMYLAYFEQIAAAAVTSLGGPQDWALPFWDYNESGNPAALQVPPPFLVPDTPAAPNPLWTKRGNTQLQGFWVSLNAMNNFPFTGNAITAPHSFGGPATAFSHDGSLHAHGAIEAKPHDLVHDAMQGLMSDSNTAPLDPLFWLHHANIDRLWQVWLNLGGRNNPAEPGWLNTRFLFHNSQGIEESITAQDVLNSSQILGNGYTYQVMTDNIPPGPPPPAAPVVSPLFAFAQTPPAEVMAASNLAVSLTSGAQNITLDYLSDTPRRSNMNLLSLNTSPPSVPGKVYLHFENMTGAGQVPIFEIYLNPGTPDEPDDDRHVDSLSFFGVENSSTPSDHHNGSGMHQIIDISEMFDQLRNQPGWDSRQLQILLKPAWPMPAGASATIGRISLYANHG